MLSGGISCLLRVLGIDALILQRRGGKSKEEREKKGKAEEKKAL